MRKKILAGNWKMNTDLKSGLELAKAVSEKASSIDFDTEKFGLVIGTPFTHLHAVSQVIDASKVQLSSQNIAAEEKGAFTGEISAEMLKSVGTTTVILGHSERRAYYCETSETLYRKIRITLDNDLMPIFCFGEVLEEREADKHFEVVKSQIAEVLFNLEVADFEKVVLAYEPVWAIGTGKTASPEQAQEIHAFIRKIVADKFGQNVADNTTILYGGSCKPSNADGLFSQRDIDGGLIGGAALKADNFIEHFKIRMKY